MTVSTETEKELWELITAGFTDLKIGQARIEEKINGIDKRLELIENRVNNQTSWFIGSFVALVGGLLGILSKFVFFPNP
jgi:tetrahydromethanopterin S-methyltransferase subunit G